MTGSLVGAGHFLFGFCAGGKLFTEANLNSNRFNYLWTCEKARFISFAHCAGKFYHVSLWERTGLVSPCRSASTID